MRTGILAAGNFIVDYVKIISDYPQQDMLASIYSETHTNGGGAYNVLKDLAKMEAKFPLQACGLVGADDKGNWVKKDCEEAGIDTTYLAQDEKQSTSYTDAMTVQSTGRRTFFHQRGANQAFDGSQIDFEQCNTKLFYLGYLMLLDKIDSYVEEGGLTFGAQLLKQASESGLTTCVDLVSQPQPQYKEKVTCALPYIDILILNEVEAELVTEKSIRPNKTLDSDAVIAAAKALLSLGVRKTVVVHFPEGAIAVESNGAIHQEHSLKLPQDYIRGATGAGDAFAAGLLYCLHEEKELTEGLQLGIDCAAACLASPGPSEGLLPLAEVKKLRLQFPPQ